MTTDPAPPPVPTPLALVGVEEHWVPEGLDRALRALPPEQRDDSLALNDRGDTAARLADTGPGRLAAMDAQGVQVHVLSVAPPGAQGLTGPLSTALAREANDQAAAAVAAAPTRLRAMAALPLDQPAAAAAELERAADLGLVGAMVYGRTGGTGLDDPRLDDVWAVAEARRLPVFIHPQIPPRSVRAASYSGLGRGADLALATFAWGWHVEAGTAALRLMASGALDRHPDLQLVLGHWGELLLFWHDRADALARTAGLQRTVTDYLRDNVWVTASGMLDPALLRHALAVTTPDRLLFSTDYPFAQPTEQAIGDLLACFDSDADRTAFAHGGARALFGLP